MFADAVERMLPGSGYDDQSRALAKCLTLKDVERPPGDLPRASQSLPLREAAAAAVGIRVTGWREPARFDIPAWIIKYASHIDDPAAREHMERFIDLVGACEVRWKVGPDDRVLFGDVTKLADELKLLPPALAARATGKSPIKRSELIRRHKKNWTSIESDLGQASKPGFEGLKAAQEEPSGWYEDIAVEWAKSKGRYHQDQGEKGPLWLRGIS